MTKLKVLVFDRYRWASTAIGLAVVFCIFNHLLVFGQAVANWDGDGYFFPYYTLVADFARSGQLLVWDPWTNGGIPIAGDPQVGAFSPLLCVFGLLTGGSSYGFILYWLFLWLFGGIGILLIAKSFDTPLWAAVVIALGFLFSGFYMGDAEYTSWISSFSFLPWTVWRFDTALRTRRVLPAFQAAGLWGISALHGYPGFTIITGLFCAGWALARCFSNDPDSVDRESLADVEQTPTPLKKLAFAAVALVIVAGAGGLILSPTYFSFFYEGVGHHRRVETLTRTLATSGNDLSPSALSTLASPYLGLLKQYVPNLFPGTDVSSVSVYMGAFVIAFAAFALAAKPRNTWRWGLLTIALVFFGLALGEALPLRGWLYDLVYPTRFFRHSSLIRGHAMLAIAVLAMFGARDLSRSLDNGLRRHQTLFFVVTTVCTVLAVAVFFATLGTVSPTQRDYVGWGYAHLGIAWGSVLASGLLIKFGSQRVRTAIPIAIVLFALADAYVASRIGAPILMETDPNRVKQWQALDQRHVASVDLKRTGFRREESSCGGKTPCKSNYQLLIKVPSFDAFSTEKNDIHETMVATAVLRQMASGSDRIWFTPTVGLADLNDDAAVTAFVKRSTQLGAPVLVLTPQDVAMGRSPLDANATMTSIAELPAAKPALSTLVSYTPNSLDIRVTVPENGFLLVTDRWARSWSANVNGNPTPIDVGNFLFRALPVTAGENTISFTYAPAAVPWLVVLSWGMLGAILVASAVQAFLRNRSC